MPTGGDAADLPHVDTHLGRVADAHADQFEVGMLQHFRNDHPADETRTPDHHTLGHARS